MKLYIDTQKLVDHQVIQQEQANAIVQFYDKQVSNPGSNRLLVIFGILGALLVSAGIILVFAHNWDSFSKTFKSILAFVPLLLGQGLCAFTLVKRSESTVWREAAASFLYVSIGACISLISQIYQMDGSIGSLLLIWMALGAPLAYIMRSNVSYLITLVWLLWFYLPGVFDHQSILEFSLPFVIFFSTLPIYFRELRKKTNLSGFFNYIILAIVCAALPNYIDEGLLYPIYLGLFWGTYQLGQLPMYRVLHKFANAFKIVGYLGVITLLFTLRFTDILVYLQLHSVILFAAVLVAILGVSILQYKSNRSIQELSVLTMATIITTIAFPNQYLIDGLFFAYGILLIFKGHKCNHLGILNQGTVILAILLTIHFFNEDLSFVFKGVAAVVLGISFFLSNILLIRKRQKNEA